MRDEVGVVILSFICLVVGFFIGVAVGEISVCDEAKDKSFVLYHCKD